MTPAETEHFAALRMHVARLHAALNVANSVFGPATENAENDALRVTNELRSEIAAALKLSEPDVRELLAEADRDNALVQCRAELETVRLALTNLGITYQPVLDHARVAMAAWKNFTHHEAGWKDEEALEAAMDDLAKAFPS